MAVACAFFISLYKLSWSWYFRSSGDTSTFQIEIERKCHVLHRIASHTQVLVHLFNVDRLSASLCGWFVHVHKVNKQLRISLWPVHSSSSICLIMAITLHLRSTHFHHWLAIDIFKLMKNDALFSSFLVLFIASSRHLAWDYFLCSPLALCKLQFASVPFH